MTDIGSSIQLFAVSALPLMMAIVFHEVAHGYVAWRLGDPTAKMLGRVTLNPIPHVDPVGTILVPGLLMLSNSPMLFGWAKPVPVNMRLLRDQKTAPALVSGAGIVVNFGLLVLSFIALRLMGAGELFTGGKVVIPEGAFASAVYEPFVLMLAQSIRWNLGLMTFNLLPIPGLDGWGIISPFLPYSIQAAVAPFERYVFLIVPLLLFMDPFGIIRGTLRLLQGLILGLFL